MRNRPVCLKCKRPLKNWGDECLHGLGPAPEPWDGGLSMSAEEIAKAYEISLDEAQVIYDSIH